MTLSGPHSNHPRSTYTVPCVRIAQSRYCNQYQRETDTDKATAAIRAGATKHATRNTRARPTSMPRKSLVSRVSLSRQHHVLTSSTAAISEDESSGSEVPDDVPAKAPAPKGTGKDKGKAVAASVEEPEPEPEPAPEPAPEDDADDSEEGEGEGEDEYVVEGILDHAYEKKKLKYQVKWLGYNNPEDITWEPVENL